MLETLTARSPHHIRKDVTVNLHTLVQVCMRSFAYVYVCIDHWEHVYIRFNVDMKTRAHVLFDREFQQRQIVCVFVFKLTFTTRTIVVKTEALEILIRAL